MGDKLENVADKELRACRREQFLYRAWVYGAALALLVLILFSKVIILSEVASN
jgi:hypothetical protein